MNPMSQPDRLRGSMQRITGRRYNVKVEMLDDESRRELARFLRDVEDTMGGLKRRARQPWRFRP
jgi:hypothetical protein